MKVQLYANYGVLSHEKQPLYREHPVSEIHDKIFVDIPDELEPEKTNWGHTIVKINGVCCPLYEILETNKNDDPVIYNGSKYIELQILEG